MVRRLQKGKKSGLVVKFNTQNPFFGEQWVMCFFVSGMNGTVVVALDMWKISFIVDGNSG